MAFRASCIVSRIRIRTHINFFIYLYITHYQAIYVLEIVRVCFDKLKKKALPLQSI